MGSGGNIPPPSPQNLCLYPTRWLAVLTPPHRIARIHEILSFLFLFFLGFCTTYCTIVLPRFHNSYPFYKRNNAKKARVPTSALPLSPSFQWEKTMGLNHVTPSCYLLHQLLWRGGRKMAQLAIGIGIKCAFLSCTHVDFPYCLSLLTLLFHMLFIQ